MENQTTTVTKFILLGFPISRKIELLFFVLLLPIYLMTLLGNILIIYIVVSNSRLYTPMYFFFCNLSILDILFTSVISPREDNSATGDKTISFSGCITQCYFYFFLGTVEFLLLTSMSYDRYAAISNPLGYSTIMGTSVCIGLVLFSWVGGFLSVLFPTILISRLPFCGSNIINHYFCDSGPLLALAYTDTTSIKLMDFLLSSTVIIFSIILTGYSYACIIMTILQIPSASGRKKAFNMTIVVIAGGITAFICVTPFQKETLEINKIPSVLSSVVAPFLNPFIYTLHNDTVLGILREVWVGIREVLVGRGLLNRVSKKDH